MKKTALRISTLMFALFLTACSTATQIPPTATQPSSLPKTEGTATFGTPIPFPTNVRIEGETEYRIPDMLGFDAIPPIYEPRFVSAQESPLFDDELVMGLAIEGEAKAYPVTVLRFREMVNDEIASWPVLVTW